MEKLKAAISHYNELVRKDNSVARTFSFHYNVNKKYSLMLGREIVCEFDKDDTTEPISAVFNAESRFTETGVPL